MKESESFLNKECQDRMLKTSQEITLNVLEFLNGEASLNMLGFSDLQMAIIIQYALIDLVSICTAKNSGLFNFSPSELFVESKMSQKILKHLYEYDAALEKFLKDQH